ncbi:MAG TPA: adenosylcobinamide-GDP ribazoletransferase [Candidatus Bathyarchaeia archaeon]|nr:adenosylcobinamide-GDP ribazoletransferase [Candidatus Bathyarchaeia archaeon]
MLKEIKNLLSFLTTIPVRMDKDCLVDSARFMFVFPLIGALLGLLAGLFGWLTSLFLPSLVVGGLILGVLLLLTGLHHTDGLLDFGDGVMAHGSSERKIEVMHDQLTGAGGLSLGIMTFLVTAFSIAELDLPITVWGIPVIISGLVVAEVSAKLSMVVGAWAGRAVHEGMNSSFLAAMHGEKGDARLIAALAISLGVAVPLLWLAGAIAVLAAVITGLVMVGISHWHFNGVTGDVLGATNELSRMVSLITLLAVIRWV